nr:MAG TPA: hypothetical protein [Caudoviricetes sp.]
MKYYKSQPRGESSLGCFYAQKLSYHANLKPFNDSFFYR